MTKLYTLLIGAALTTSAFAQNLDQKPVFKTNHIEPNQTIKARALNNLKSAPIWENDFSNPGEWVINNDAGNTDDWVIGTGIPTGPYKIAGIMSTSGGNFGLFDSDAMCSGTQLANLQIKDPINLSAYPAVSLQFEEFYRRFQEKTYVEVSNDNGATWVKYEVNKTLSANQAVATNPTIVIVDITPTAGGQGSVLFRFRYEGGCDYAWMVDDIKIIETPANNLTINKAWHGDIINDYEYRQIPLSQAHPLTVAAVVSNDGGLSQDNVILTIEVKNTTTSNTVSYVTPAVTLGVGAIDTLEYIVPKLTEAGNYEIILTLSDDSPDATPGNNKETRFLTMTSAANAVFSHGAPAWGGGYYNAFESSTPGLYEPLKIMNNYRVYAAGDKIYSMSLLVTDATTPGQDIIVDLNKYDDPTNPDPDNMTSVASVTYVVDAADLSVSTTNYKYLTIRFDNPIDLVKDAVYGVSAEVYGGSDAFSFGTSSTNNDGSSLIYVLNNGTTGWFSLGSSPILQMNLASTTGISAKQKGKIAVNTYPNPAKDRVTVNFNLDKNQVVNFSLNDITGKTVMNKNIDGVSGANSVKLESLNLRPGIYFYTLNVNGSTTSNKLVISE